MYANKSGGSFFVTRDWLDYANFVTLTATLIVVVIYSWLTHGLRKEAEKQNESSILPILILDWPNPEIGSRDAPSVKNIGRGPAFNVRISPIIHAGMKIAFSDFGLLQVEGRSVLLMQITQIVEQTARRLVQRGHTPTTQTLADLIQIFGIGEFQRD
jgi:hypothetical protein